MDYSAEPRRIVASSPSNSYTFLVADRSTKPGMAPAQQEAAAATPAPVPARPSSNSFSAEAPTALSIDDEDAGTAEAASSFEDSASVSDSLPSHLYRSGEIEQSEVMSRHASQSYGWEEKTVVDDGQLQSVKDASASQSLISDDELTIEDSHMSVPSLPPGLVPRNPSNAGRTTESGSRGKLVVVAGNDRGRDFPLSGETITVGRSIDNDVVLTDIAVSRKHLAIQYDGDRYLAVDIGSGNGTLINKHLQSGTHQLRHGDQIEIGNTVFRFEHPESKNLAPASWLPGDDRAQSSPQSEDEETLTVNGSLLGLGNPNAQNSAASDPGDAPQRPKLPPPRRSEPVVAQSAIPASNAQPDSGSISPPTTLQVQTAAAGTPAPVVKSTGFAEPPAPPYAPGGFPPAPPVIRNSEQISARVLPLARGPVTYDRRKATIGVIATLLGLVALAILGLLLDDEPNSAPDPAEITDPAAAVESATELE